MSDSLGDRMKRSYENRTRYYLPRRTYTIIRVDGKAFHSLLRHAEKPFDKVFMHIMDLVAEALVHEIQGGLFGFIQSDEVSVLAADFENESTEAWFDGNIQKQASIAAAIATARFNDPLDVRQQFKVKDPAFFDARTFTIPDPIEVENYLIWRQRDAERNSVSMIARTHYSHSQLMNKTASEMQDLLMAVGVNWNDVEPYYKRGRIYSRHRGMIYSIPVFTKDRVFLRTMIPRRDVDDPTEMPALR